MNQPFPPPQIALRWLVAGTMALALLSQGFAQESTKLTIGGTETFLRILDQQVLDFSERSLIYNRVQTPFLKPQPPPLPATGPAAPRALTAEEQAMLDKWNAKEDVFMFLSCTIYGDGSTEVRWGRKDGEYVIWSSIDFNYLGGIFQFKAKTTRYNLFLSIDDKTSESSRAWNAEVDARKLSPALKGSVPTLNNVSGVPSVYRIISAPNTGTNLEVTRAMEALHRYFDANRERLVWEYKEAEAARIAEEKWNREHPPAPKETRINYFPIRSRYNSQQAPGGSR